MTLPPAARSAAASTGVPAAPVVLVTGNDALGVEREARRFASSVPVPGPGERRIVRVAGVGKPATLAEERAASALEAATTGSLFGDGALVIVADAPALFGVESAGRALGDAIRLVADGNVLALLALADESDRQPAATRSLGEVVREAGGEVRDVRVPSDLGRWIADIAPEVGVRLGHAAAAELARRVGGQDRSRDVDHRAVAADAAAELAKLALYRDGGEVTVDDVRAVVAERLPTSLFELIDAIGARQARRSIALLDRASATVPGPVLVARLHARLREIAIVGDLAAAGEPGPVIVKALGWRTSPGVGWRLDKVAGQARHWGPGEVEAALDGLLEVDAGMKGESTVSERAQRLALTLWVVESVDPR
jgi:DNA polymerase III delta subunit